MSEQAEQVETIEQSRRDHRWARVRVSSPGGPLCQGTTVWLDGKDVSRYIRGISFRLEVGEIKRVALELIPGEVEIDAETEAYLVRRRLTLREWWAGRVDSTAMNCRDFRSFGFVRTWAVRARRAFFRPQGLVWRAKRLLFGR